MKALHILSADLLYSLYLQLTYGVAAVGMLHPFFIHISSLSIILLIAGMILEFLNVASPLMISASVWLSTMILMHCALSAVGFHSPFKPSVDPSSAFSGFASSCSFLLWCGVSCLSSGGCVALLWRFSCVPACVSSAFVSGLGGIPSLAIKLSMCGLHCFIQDLLE